MTGTYIKYLSKLHHCINVRVVLILINVLFQVLTIISSACLSGLVEKKSRSRQAEK